MPFDPLIAVMEYEKNKNGRDFVCGDIHGCFDDLDNSLCALKFDQKKDRLFSVGDLFDRGPRSHDALDYLQAAWFHSVLGNHEDMFLEYYKKYQFKYKDNSYENGSSWQTKENHVYLLRLARAVNKLPLIIKVGNTLIVHACPPSVNSLDDINKDPEKYVYDTIWHRGKMPDRITIPGITRVYCGHNPVHEIQNYNGIINIDTGAFQQYHDGKGKLTVVEMT